MLLVCGTADALSKCPFYCTCGRLFPCGSKRVLCDDCHNSSRPKQQILGQYKREWQQYWRAHRRQRRCCSCFICFLWLSFASCVMRQGLSGHTPLWCVLNPCFHQVFLLCRCILLHLLLHAITVAVMCVHVCVLASEGQLSSLSKSSSSSSRKLCSSSVTDCRLLLYGVAASSTAPSPRAGWFLNLFKKVVKLGQAALAASMSMSMLLSVFLSPFPLLLVLSVRRISSLCLSDCQSDCGL